MLDLVGLCEDFVGRRVLVDGKRIPTCPHCGRHVVCYSVSVFHYVREKNRLQCPALNLVCPECSRYTPTLPIYPSLAGKVSVLPLETEDRARLCERGFLEAGK